MMKTMFGLILAASGLAGISVAEDMVTEQYAMAEDIEITVPMEPEQVVLPSNPREMVLVISRNVLDMVEKDKNLETLAPKLIDTLEPVVDFDGIAKAVMGKYYKKADEKQQKQFLNIFKTTLGQLYAKTLIQFKIANLEVEKSEFKDDTKGSMIMRATAETGEIYLLNYSMRKNTEGQWQIKNVILDGINLGLTYRSQFYSAAEQNGGDVGAVIANWYASMQG